MILEDIGYVKKQDGKTLTRFYKELVNNSYEKTEAIITINKEKNEVTKTRKTNFRHRGELPMSLDEIRGIVEYLEEKK